MIDFKLFFGRDVQSIYGHIAKLTCQYNDGSTNSFMKIRLFGSLLIKIAFHYSLHCHPT
jgi:hypothetical protein